MSEVLLVTGPAGAGKSTTCEEFAKSGDGMWALIEQDHIRQFVKAGFKNPAKPPWTDETQTQWDVSIDICGDMARRYQQRDINCIIDCFATLDSFDKWDKGFESVDYKIIVLLPDVEVALARNNQRSGDAKLLESQVREHHEWLAAWHDDERARVIDTSKLSVQGVVQAIREGL